MESTVLAKFITRYPTAGDNRVEKAGGVVVGVGSLIDRSGGAAQFAVTRVALATVRAQTWKPEACLLCTTGSPAIKPGSRS